MNNRIALSPIIKKNVLERDDYKCVKCGRYRNLEIHHIIPVYKDGVEGMGNLITLCSRCHRAAPNEPIDFFKWAAHHMSPDMERSKDLAKPLFAIMVYRHKLSTPEKFKELYPMICADIDDIYGSMWRVMVSNDISELSKFAEKFFKEK